MKLIDDIKQFPKFFSVHAAILGSALVAFATANPDLVSAAIDHSVSPHNVPYATIGVSLLLQLLGRAVAQPKLDTPPAPREPEGGTNGT